MGVTPEELRLLGEIGRLNDEFCKLPVQYAEDRHDFRRLVQRLQDLVAARAACRELNRVCWPDQEGGRG